MSFSGEDDLRVHLSEQHNKNKYTTCIVCCMELTTKQSLRRHVLAHTGFKVKKTMKVISCDEIEAGEDGITKCRMCLKSFVNETLLRNHMQTVHNKNGDTICLLCLKELKSHRTLLDHMNTHRGDLKHKCQFCGKRFVNPTRLKNHIQSVHQEVKELKKPCPKCGRTITLSMFEKHLKLHDQPKKFVCEICKWVYASRSGLDLHSRIVHKTV